jgi:hypothetical protein
LHGEIVNARICERVPAPPLTRPASTSSFILQTEIPA